MNFNKNYYIMRIHLFLTATLILSFFCCESGANDKKNNTISEQSEERAPAPDDYIVDRSKQAYSYSEMLEDLKEMQNRWPDYISFEMRDKTCQGRGIPLVYFGNKEAEHYVLIQASIHAREYMSTLIVMSMLEHYLVNFKDGSFHELKLSDIFEKVCLVIMPMVNPDGVEIAQRGEQGAVTEDVKQWVRANTKAGTKHDQIKSNARGVDLNRNFNNGFGKDRNRKSVKGYSHYPGASPLSEVESKLLMKVAKERKYACFLNYHTSGNLIYYGCGNAPQNVNARALKIANIIKNHTKFEPRGSGHSAPCGSWADEVEVRFNTPSVTIELGTRNPVPLSEFNRLYQKNLWVWADLAIQIMNNKIS
ncbi:hypothetical protein C7Y71_006740 [Pseudoprevotella muciniphila]|uniref:Peptidase M14 domain-containing protein n=2 Tax=Pseudoprevotella muciniphila TaxID=2133944 RepID=A0A5P8E770_9BACT|nr:hypothetical protein C7Y71_006740 [Pseudoprevotella muciniphila]